MKQKRNRTSNRRIQPTAPVRVSAGRRWCARILGLLAPFVLLGLIEFGLRAAGYGYPPEFFLPKSEGERDMVISNLRFGWRFFPPAIARAPRPLYLTARKPQNTVRIFVFGESAAMGDPEPAYGFARQLEVLLQAHHPGQKVQVINVGMTAINSHVIREISHDCAPLGGDFWLVYAGNNEVIGPFGAGTVFGQQSPARWVVRSMMELRSMRLGQFLTHITRGAGEPKQWEGLEFFLKWQVTSADPRLRNVYSSFAANLADIADSGRKSGATVILATLPVNLRDFPPLASVHRGGLRPDELTSWQKHYDAGIKAQAEGRHDEALIEYHRAGEIDDTFAELSYQRGRCEKARGQMAAADSEFRRARDLDALRFRADSRINDMIRQAAKLKGVPLIDASEEFTERGDESLFYDHVHLSFSGNYLLALHFATKLENHWPEARSDPVPWLSENEVAQRLAWTGFDQRRVLEEMRARMQQPPFNAQSNFRRRDDNWSVMLAALTNAPVEYIPKYEAAVAPAPDDWILAANFARVLEAAGDFAGAEKQWAGVSRLMPHFSEGWANQGRLARIVGDTDRSKSFLAAALRQQPYSPDTLTESGLLHASLGESGPAKKQFRAALKWQPGYTPARVNLGLLLAKEGDVAGAAHEYYQALRWQTNNVEARINLANLLAAQGQANEAETWFEQALELEPSNAIARYNLGRLLASMNRPAEAFTNFQLAVKQQPGLGEIRFELGNVLTRLGRESEALEEFAQAVRLKPDLAEAHLNLGVALARSRRYAEAIEEFQATLLLQPNDPRAQRMLDQARSLASERR